MSTEALGFGLEVVGKQQGFSQGRECEPKSRRETLTGPSPVCMLFPQNEGNGDRRG
jgi:hypothetical protein